MPRVGDSFREQLARDGWHLRRGTGPNSVLVAERGDARVYARTEKELLRLLVAKARS